MKTTRVLISIALLSSAFTSALFAQASAAADTTTVATDTTAESTAASTEAAVTATMSASTDTTTTSASTDTATASAAATDTATADDKKDEKKVSSSKAGVSVVPAAKRPVKPTAEQLSEAEVSDPGSYEKNSETLKFGLESDITDLLETLTKNKDVRFADDIYDLFESTKSASVRESVLGYFTELKDPCLEDYAVTILNDPYDEKKSTVDAVFRYVQTMKTKAAVPAVLTLLESENQDYFDGALETLGDIGVNRRSCLFD